jgi:MFS family permease
MKTGQSHVAQGAVLGFVAGLAIGGAFALGGSSSAGEEQALRNLGYGMTAIVLGPLVGSLLFTTHGWHTIYRRQ